MPSRKNITIIGVATDGVVMKPAKSKSRIYVDRCAVAPAPSRDYYRLFVNEEHISLTRWVITHKSPTPTPPIETKIPLDEGYEKNHELVFNIGQVFGSEIGDYVKNLSKGRRGTIAILPENVLANIFDHVGIKSLRNLAPVCKSFETVCKSNALWERFYKEYMDTPSQFEENEEEGETQGWLATFLDHRLQDNVFFGKPMKLGKTGPVTSRGDNNVPPQGDTARYMGKRGLIRHRRGVPQPRPRLSSLKPPFGNVMSTKVDVRMAKSKSTTGGMRGTSSSIPIASVGNPTSGSGKSRGVHRSGTISTAESGSSSASGNSNAPGAPHKLSIPKSRKPSRIPVIEEGEMIYPFKPMRKEKIFFGKI